MDSRLSQYNVDLHRAVVRAVLCTVGFQLYLISDLTELYVAVRLTAGHRYCTAVQLDASQLGTAYTAVRYSCILTAVRVGSIPHS